MVRAIEAPGLRMRVGRVVPALLLALGDEVVEQGNLGVTADGEILLATPDVEHVRVDHRYGLAERIERVGRIIFAAEQALLFGSDGQEHNRTIGPGTAGEGARLLDHVSDSGAVVDGPIIDVVAVGIRLADAEMVPMRAIDQRLVGKFLPWQDTDDIVRRNRFGLRLESRVERSLQRNRLEGAGLRRGLRLLEVQTRRGKDLLREGQLNPALERGVACRRILADDVELRVGVGVLDRVPTVRGGRRLVNDEHAGRAAPRGLLVLIGPATVIGHRLAAEVSFAAFEVGIVDQQDEELAVDINALEIIPISLGRADSVADEEQRRIGERDRRLAVHRGARGDVVALSQWECLAVAEIQVELWSADDVRLKKRYVLRPFPGAARKSPAWLKPRRPELLDQVIDRLRFAFRRRAPALEGIRSDRLDFL